MTPTHAPFFFADARADGSVSLRGEDARHLSRVRRARDGDLVRVGDGAGTIHEVRLTAISEDTVEGNVVATQRIPKRAPRIAVFQALAKGGKADAVIQKLVEVGVDQIVLFTSGRSVPDWDQAKGQKMLQRWEAIATGASKQSHRAWLPLILGPLTFEELSGQIRPPALLGVPEAEVTLRRALPEHPELLSIIVGPEGGLTPEEVETLESSGAQAVSLGPQILRTETAAMAMSAAVMYHYGLLG